LLGGSAIAQSFARHLASGQAFCLLTPTVVLSDYIPQFIAARSDPHLSLRFGQITRIISFPSYRAAAAVLLGYAFAALPRWVVSAASVLEIAFVISAVLVGGHYLVDVLAGILIVVASLEVVRRYAAARSPLDSQCSERSQGTPRLPQ
jgi:PAP2 superfamily